MTPRSVGVIFFFRGLERRLSLEFVAMFPPRMGRWSHASGGPFIWERGRVCTAELIITVCSYGERGEFRSPARPVPSLHALQYVAALMGNGLCTSEEPNQMRAWTRGVESGWTGVIVINFSKKSRGLEAVLLLHPLHGRDNLAPSP